MQTERPEDNEGGIMIFPRKITPGAAVGLVCPSSPIQPERVKECIKAVSNLGYKVKAADNLDKVYGGYMAGIGKARGQYINKMFADPEVEAVFCIRGGHGSSRIMEYLDYDLIRRNPKIFVGYSDVTNLHLAFNQRCGFVTFHGPMVWSNMVKGFDEETRESLFNVINAEEPFSFMNPEGFDIKVMRSGKARGRLIGGNLSLLSASIGTPYEIDTNKKVLFIEEVKETVSRIEKWAYHLRNCGKLAQCSGIILGQFTDITNPKDPGYDVLRCFDDVFQGLDIPIMYNLQSGHAKPMMTLPMGAVCSLDADSKSIFFEVEK